MGENMGSTTGTRPHLFPLACFLQTATCLSSLWPHSGTHTTARQHGIAPSFAPPDSTPPARLPKGLLASLRATDLLLPDGWMAFDRKHACLPPYAHAHNWSAVDETVPYVVDRRLSQIIQDVSSDGARPAVARFLFAASHCPACLATGIVCLRGPVSLAVRFPMRTTAVAQVYMVATLPCALAESTGIGCSCVVHVYELVTLGCWDAGFAGCGAGHSPGGGHPREHRAPFCVPPRTGKHAAGHCHRDLRTHAHTEVEITYALLLAPNALSSHPDGLGRHYPCVWSCNGNVDSRCVLINGWMLACFYQPCTGTSPHFASFFCLGFARAS